MLEVEMMGRNGAAIHPTVFHDGEHAVLVDVGMPGQLESLKAALAKANLSVENIDAVIFTHQDIDHIGGIRELQQAAGKPIDVYAHPEDQPYIQGEKTLVKMTPERAAQMLERIPESFRAQAQAMFSNPPSAKVTHQVQDGDVLPMFGGIEVIYTPGHTPGHISLYHRPSKTLVTGDALVSQDGKIFGPNPQVTADMAMATESAKKFGKFDVQQVVCYHGGLCTDNVNAQLGPIGQ